MNSDRGQMFGPIDPLIKKSEPNQTDKEGNQTSRGPTDDYRLRTKPM